MMATVTGICNDYIHVDIVVDGAHTAIRAQRRDGYWPAVGDRVVVNHIGGKFVVVYAVRTPALACRYGIAEAHTLNAPGILPMDAQRLNIGNLGKLDASGRIVISENGVYTITAQVRINVPDNLGAEANIGVYNASGGLMGASAWSRCGSAAMANMSLVSVMESGWIVGIWVSADAFPVSVHSGYTEISIVKCR